MKTSKNRVLSTLAAVTMASVIGLAYAETGYSTKSGTSSQGTTGTSNVNATTGTTTSGASGTTNLNANDTASQGNSGNMNQNTAGPTSRGTSGSMNQDTSGNMSDSTTSSDRPYKQRVARADRS